MARRRPEVFTLAFLDAMTCGLGAVILLYMILNAAAARQRDDALLDRLAQADLRERQVLEEHARLVELQSSLERLEDESEAASGLSSRMLEELRVLREELATFDESRLAQREHLAALQADLRSLEEDLKRLSASRASEEVPGERVRSFVGDGDRQYLTGLKVGGERILILVDGSASMLADTLVNVLRFRNLPAEEAREADKWRQAVSVVDWLLTQVPRGSQVQVLVFAETAEPVTPGAGWIPATDGARLDELVLRLRERTPASGTSLHQAFAAAARLVPAPDNILLVTDGLPTQGEEPKRRGTVSGEQRLRLFARALEELPRGVPVNTILLPMEGDPMAASAFWELAIRTDGSYLSPTEDWP